MKHLCKCGCGQKTKVISKTSIKDKRIKGKFNKFIRGHWAKCNKKILAEIAKRTMEKNGNPMHLISYEKKESWKRN